MILDPDKDYEIAAKLELKKVYWLIRETKTGELTLVDDEGRSGDYSYEHGVAARDKATGRERELWDEWFMQQAERDAENRMRCRATWEEKMQELPVAKEK